jgi:hypothetical protein
MIAWFEATPERYRVKARRMLEDKDVGGYWQSVNTS